jgi:hypothetical protein
MKKDERQKHKRWPRAGPSSSLSSENSFPVAQRCNRHDLLASLSASAACYGHALSCASLCAERRLGGIVVVTPVAVEVWMSWWWNDRGHVGSGCGSRAPVECARSHPSHRWEQVPRLGAPWLPILPEGSTRPLGEAEAS